MDHRGGLTPGAAGALAALTTVVILYGSLYPFRFPGPADWGMAAEALLASWRRLTSRGDIISNLLLYAPLGFFGAKAAARLRRPTAVALLTLACAAMSVGIELLQFRTAWRSTAMSDVYMNTAGAFAGALAGAFLRLAAPRNGPGREPARGFAALALTAWLGWRLFPYEPSFRWPNIENALATLTTRPLTAAETFWHFAIWLAVALLLEAVAGPERRRAAFAALVVGVLALRCAMEGALVTPGEVAGAGAALFVWSVGLAAAGSRPRIVLALLAAAIVLQGLEPFVVLPRPRPFGWIPFRGLLVGPAENNVRSFLEKCFMYSALLWVLVRSGVRFLPAVLAATVLIAALEWAQTWLPWRSAEITDVLLVAILALALWLTGGGRAAPT
jgi:VanZ family protein